MPPRRAITDVAGILVGHATDHQAATGCTVVLGPAEGMVGAVFVRGRATGTRELDALDPRHLVPAINAILLTGGSAFGLGAADGVMRWLAAHGRGFPVGAGVVPIVPAAVIFDLLPLGAADRWPQPDDAMHACQVAGTDVAEGSVGAGTGATVGKVLGAAGAMKGGVGTWSESAAGVVVGALAVVNAFGDVRDGSGAIIAGARRSGGFVDARAHLAAGGEPGGSFARQGANTTLVVVATDAALDKLALVEVAQAAADALGQRITPVGTAYDGDLVFAVSAGRGTARSITVELMAQAATGAAVERAVRQARGTPAVPGLADRQAH
ncbi:MAG TPA: P1 family peptidase [Gemmatimonadales bacterium]|nr:P1 family peptidase [Gemmatimonadales bacterium]